MNIVIFTDTYLPKIDGVAISVDHFTRILASRGHHFVICAPAYTKSDIETIGTNIHIVRFKSAPLPSYPDIKVVLPSNKKIKKAMSMFTPDIVHIQTPGLLGQYGAMAAKMYNIPCVGTYHTLVSEQHTYMSLYRLLKVDTLLNYFKKNKKVKKRLDKIERKKETGLRKSFILKLCNKLYNKCNLVISPSYRIEKELHNYGIKPPIHVISNGMNLKMFKGTRKHRIQGSPKLLHVGRISYEKNCDVILKAFALILERYPDASLDIVGDGPALTSMKIEAEQLALSEKVNFTGFVDQNVLPTIYADHDIFLTASTMETQGLVVLEAMACALPCVGVDSYALPEIIRHQQNGFIAEPFDHHKLAEYTMRLIEDGDLYENFSQESLNIASEHELSECANRLEESYKLLAAREFGPPFPIKEDQKEEQTDTEEKTIELQTL